MRILGLLFVAVIIIMLTVLYMRKTEEALEHRTSTPGGADARIEFAREAVNEANEASKKAAEQARKAME